MISLQHLLQNPELYKHEMQKRFLDDYPIDKIINYHEQVRPLLLNLEECRQIKNEFNTIVIKLEGEEKLQKIQQMKVVSDRIKELEDLTKHLNHKIQTLLYQIPNITWEGMPVAADDKGNVETAIYGTKPEFSFTPKNYYDLPVFKKDYLSEKGVEAAGFRGYYIKGNLARFQKVLFDWVLDRLTAKGFDYIIPPVFVNEDVMYGSGFFPTGKDDVYEVSSGDRTQYLPGTSEAALMFMYSNQTLDLSDPIRLTAWTRCFRKEVGAHGKDTKGGFRVNQFEKIETVYICKPEDTYRMFDEMTSVFRETLIELGLHFHDLETSSGDNSYKNHRMIDIEAWFPAEHKFREVCSSSICTDYQTRNMNIKYKKGDGTTELAHSLNCTGITNRTMLAIMEQFQTEDGRVKVPKVLVERYGSEWLE